MDYTCCALESMQPGLYDFYLLVVNNILLSYIAEPSLAIES